MIATFYGALAGVYLLCGRWDLFRMSEGAGKPAFYSEVRFWVVLLLGTAFLANANRPPEGNGWRVHAPLVAFLSYVLLSAAWSPDHDLALAKGYDVVLLGVASLGFASVLSHDEAGRALESFWATIVAFAGGLALMAAANMVTTGATGERLAVLGGGPNVFVRIVGYLALGSLFLWKKHGMPLVFIPSIAIAVMMATLSGSRGGLLALACSIVCFVALEARRAGRYLAGLAVASAALALVATTTPIGRAAMETYQQRVVSLLWEEHYTAGRGELFRSAYEFGLASPMFGNGLAAFPARGKGVYPHNLFLEMFAETGIVGLCLLGLALGSAVAHAMRRRRWPDSATVGGLVLILVASQFSGDLYDSRGVFLFLVAAVAPGGGDARSA